MSVTIQRGGGLGEWLSLLIGFYYIVIAHWGRKSDRMSNKKYSTVVFQFVSDDGDPTEPVPFFAERVVKAATHLHQTGWGLDVKYGNADRDIMDQVEEE